MRYTFISLCIGIILLGTGFNHVQVYAQEQPQTQEATQEIGQGPVLTDKPLEIWTFIDDYRIITGKTLHLTVQLIWKLGITVNLEGVDKINLNPFRVEGVTIGERQIFDNEHDYQVITYALSLPSDTKEGIYSVPSFSLLYRNEVDQTEGKATSSPVAIKKVPILVEGKIDKDVITIGDRINYALTIRHEKDVKLLWENIEKLNFSPFEVLKRDVEKQTEGNIEKVVITYILSLYELGGKKKTPEIPELTILYYREPHPQDTARTDTEPIETKETKTVSIPIIINSLLKAVDVPLEGIKGPVYFSKTSVFLHAYLPMGFGVGLLLLLFATTIRATAKRFSSAKQEPIHETPRIALERLKNHIASFQFSSNNSANIQSIHNTDRALRAYLGTLMGISNETAQSVTTSSFLNYDTQKRLSEEASTVIKTVLKQLDTLIFGTRIEKEAVDATMQGIEEIIKLTIPK